jgi:parallel beta-helix repeat protein
MKCKYRLKNLIKILLVVCISSIFLSQGAATYLSQTKMSENITIKLGNYPINFDIIYVDDDNTDGPWDGSFDFPYQYIQEGIDNANNGDKVYVCNGTYYENIVIYLPIIVEGENRDNTIINSLRQGSVVKITSDNVDLLRFTIKFSGMNSNDAGISIHSEYNIITENNIIENNYGILTTSSNNTIIYNNFLDNINHAYDSGINVWNYSFPGGGNFWDHHHGDDDNEDGVIDNPFNIAGNVNKDFRPLLHWYGSVQNKNTSEIFLTINYAINDGETLDNHIIFVLNDVYFEHLEICKSLKILGEDKDKTIIDAGMTGDAIKICEDKVTISNFMIRYSGDEIINAGIIIDSNEVKLFDNIIEENFNGLIIKCLSDDNIISGNIIRSNNWNGICIKETCKKNIVVKNTIKNNNYAGVSVENSNFNLIYHNNFIDNRHNAYDNSNNGWDNGYPSGGNYWSDYKGKDKDGDGIGDIPHSIPDGINEDRYPLIYPYVEEDTIPPLVKIISPKNGLYISNILIFRFQLLPPLIIGRIDVVVDVSDQHSGIDRVEFYLDNNQFPEFSDDQTPYIWRWNNRILFKHNHVIRVIAYDMEGNENTDRLTVVKHF